MQQCSGFLRLSFPEEWGGLRHCSILCFVLILRLTQVNSARVSGGGRGACKDDLGLYEKREWVAAVTKTTTTTTTRTEDDDDVEDRR